MSSLGPDSGDEEDDAGAQPDESDKPDDKPDESDKADDKPEEGDEKKTDQDKCDKGRELCQTSWESRKDSDKCGADVALRECLEMLEDAGWCGADGVEIPEDLPKSQDECKFK